MSAQHLGMTKRELERELSWILRNPPDDTQALARLLASAIATLIDKNNTRIAECLAREDAPDIAEDF